MFSVIAECMVSLTTGWSDSTIKNRLPSLDKRLSGSAATGLWLEMRSNVTYFGNEITFAGDLDQKHKSDKINKDHPPLIRPPLNISMVMAVLCDTFKSHVPLLGE